MQLPDSGKLEGHCKDVADFVKARGVNIVYIALPLSNVPRMSDLMNALRSIHTASVYFVPDAFAFDIIQARLVEINGMPALSVCDTPFHGVDAMLKRTMDLVLAGVGLILVSPDHADCRRRRTVEFARTGDVPPAPLRPER